MSACLPPILPVRFRPTGHNAVKSLTRNCLVECTDAGKVIAAALSHAPLYGTVSYVEIVARLP